MRFSGLSWSLLLLCCSGCFFVGTPPLEAGSGGGVAATRPAADSSADENEPYWDVWGGMTAGQLFPRERPRIIDVGGGYHFRGGLDSLVHGPYLQLSARTSAFDISDTSAIAVGIRGRGQKLFGARSGYRYSVALTADFVRALMEGNGAYHSEDIASTFYFHSRGHLSYGLYVGADYTRFDDAGPLQNYWGVTFGVTIRLPAAGAGAFVKPRGVATVGE